MVLLKWLSSWFLISKSLTLTLTLTFKSIKKTLWTWPYTLAAWRLYMTEDAWDLRWLDPVIMWGYHPTLKLSGIPTFTLIVSLTYNMDNI